MYVDPTEYESRKNKTKYMQAMFTDVSGSINVAAFKKNLTKLKTLQAGQVSLPTFLYNFKKRSSIFGRRSL